MNTNKQNKWVMGGCDNCGVLKLVRKIKSGKQGNFMHIYICNDCKPVQ